MRILTVGDRFSGVSYHRLFMPIQMMPKTYAMLTDMLTEAELQKGYDLLVINRYIINPDGHPQPVHEVVSLCKKYGVKLVIDIDDYWRLDEWHVLKPWYPVQTILDYIIAADLVTCTNKGLQEAISSLNKNVHIIPNALPFGEDQFTDIVTPAEDDRVRFVYAAGVTHERDVAILRNPLQRVQGDFQLSAKVHFNLCGYDDSNERTRMIWHKMIHDYTAGLKLSCTIKKALPVGAYMNHYNEADAGIIPLVNSTFNSMKSNLKVLECAAKKIPCIASNVLPYSDCPEILKVNKQGDWYDHIKTLAKSESTRKKIGLANYQWAKANHDLKEWNIIRHDLYKTLI